MNLKSVEVRFLSILESLKKKEDGYIKKLDSYKYIKKDLISKSLKLKCFDTAIRDISYVKNSIEGNTIIDAGCGSGSFSVILSLLGAKRVYAVDYIDNCIEMTKFMLNIAHIDNVEVIHSDIGKLDLPENSVDGIFSIEGISHYRNYELFLNMASKVLKKGGFLLIRDGNNGASLLIKKRNFKIWDIFENYPMDAGNSIFGHSQQVDTYYLDMRRKIIENEFHILNKYEIENFAKYTFGYNKEEIIKAANQFMKGDFSLKSEYSYGKCPLDPETDCYMERLFHPKALKRELRSYGFKSKIKSCGPARRDFRVPRFFWELFSPITIFLPKGFVLIATKI